MSPQVFAPFLWITWLASWWIGARGTKKTIAKQPTGSRAAYMLPTCVGAMCFIIGERPGRSLLSVRLLAPAWLTWTGLALLAGGLLYTWWARVHLGRNWSAIVTLKQDHTLIQSGPYAITRHPIYTGILTAFLGTWLTGPTVGAFAGVALFALSFIIKLRQEEQLMIQTFGDAYREYMKRVPGLVPFAKFSPR
jgi:protein-S-isoprenylcysteine O-methyltransferase Ste14